MQIAAVQETVSVTAATPIIEITNTAAGTTIQTEQLKSLPLNGRNYQDLVLLTPETRQGSGEPRHGARLGAARHQHQHDARRSRLRQRLLRRNVRFRRRPRAALDLPGVHQGVLGHPQRHRRRVRTVRGRRDQPDHEERDERPPRLGLLLHRAARHGGKARQRCRGAGSEEAAVGRLARRADPSRPPLLFRVLRPAEAERRHPGQLRRSRSIDRGHVPDLGLGSDLRPDSERLRDVRPPRLSADGGSHRIMARFNYSQYEGDHGTSSAQTQTSGHNGIEGMQTHSYIALLEQPVGRESPE